ncbi:MAG: ADP-forming succinate--CoA ligase subunit beta [Clostridia bacterium]|nr:ADP-forming succinate--CoA ligase subunit beta [Clostridia bacterium]
MKVHEYQAKEILQKCGIAIPEQIVAFSPAEARAAADHFPNGCVVKAQVHSGGRGKAGGVMICSSPEEAERAADALIGRKLVTRQSGPEGLVVPAVLLTEKVDIDRELYLALAIDTARAEVVIIASPNGGMEIEEVAARFPEQIMQIHPGRSLATDVQVLADKCGLDETQRVQLRDILSALLDYMKEKDATLIEINPLSIVRGQLMALDARMTFDDNALFRHPELKELEDLTQIDPLERRTREIGLEYVRLDGDIACLVNGAGLAMATMDLIHGYGGKPANFLDVGGGTSAEKITAAFELLMDDPRIKSIFVNIFGGIVRCDLVAEGIVRALGETGLSVPLVVRLRGTCEAEGRAILDRAGLVRVTEDLTEAARMAISCAGGSR